MKFAASVPRSSRYAAVVLCGWLCVAVPLTSAAQDARFAAPFAVTNQSPVARLFGLPRALGGARAAAPAWQLRTELTNNFTARVLGADFVAFDGETAVVTLGVRGGVGDRWEWGVEVPFVRHAGGATDALIDGFHDIFGMPDSGRAEVARDRIDYRLRLAGRQWFEVDSTIDGPGDASIQLGYQLARSAERAVALRAQLKLPTGDAARLTGSDAADVAAWIDYTDLAVLARFGLRLSLMGGVSRLGRGELVPAAQEDYAFSGHLGVQYPATSWLTLLAQLDAHTRLIDTPFDEVIGGALLGTLGGRLHLPRGVGLDLAVVEDLRSRSAPDVTFHIALSGRF